jgi:hypothetical protein
MACRRPLPQHGVDEGLNIAVEGTLGVRRLVAGLGGEGA